MPTPGGACAQRYNAQAAVDTDTLLVVVATALTHAANDTQQVAPMVAARAERPAALGTVDTVLADNGYFSAANVTTGLAAGLEPLLAPGRESHHRPWQERFTEPAPLAAPTDAVARIKHQLKTRAGRARYGLRKQTVEPVFGILKPVMRFRQVLLRGLDAVRGAWSLVTLAGNIRRLAVWRG